MLDAATDAQQRWGPGQGGRVDCRGGPGSCCRCSAGLHTHTTHHVSESLTVALTHINGGAGYAVEHGTVPFTRRTCLHSAPLHLQSVTITHTPHTTHHVSESLTVALTHINGGAGYAVEHGTVPFMRRTCLHSAPLHLESVTITHAHVLGPILS